MERNDVGLPISGRHLRYLLVLVLDRTRSEMTLPELEEVLRAAGFVPSRPPGKAMSDSLRWAVGRGHVERAARGRYVIRSITKQTRHRYRTRIEVLRSSLVTGDRGASHVDCVAAEVP